MNYGIKIKLSGKCENNMYKCRACETNIEKSFLSLGNLPISNANITKENLNKMEKYYPLELYVCSECKLVQIDEFAIAETIFSSDYAYFSSYSESWLKHCKEYTEMMIKRFGFDENSFVLEIASNDGYLLQYFKEHNIPVLGVEPASNTAEVAIKKGIPTDIIFFNEFYANRLKESGKQADLIIGNNVLAHNPHLIDFVKGLKIALNKEGVITMEFPHLLKLIEHNEFDTIYHEHYSYFSLYSVDKLFLKYGLEIFDVEELPTHGGSLRIYAKHTEDHSKLIKNVLTIIKKERSFGLYNLDFYNKFFENVKKTKRNILQFFIQAKNDGKRIVGYGAPAKGNTLLNYCGIGIDFIDFTVDLSPHKQGKYLPGTHIPIYHPDIIRQYKPDYIIILPWNIKEEIMNQMSYIREWGGKFVVLIPEVLVLE